MNILSVLHRYKYLPRAKNYKFSMIDEIEFALLSFLYGKRVRHRILCIERDKAKSLKLSLEMEITCSLVERCYGG